MPAAQQVHLQDPELSLPKALLLVALSSACEDDPQLHQQLQEVLDMPRLEEALDKFLESSGYERDQAALRQAIVRYARLTLFDFQAE